MNINWKTPRLVKHIPDFNAWLHSTGISNHHRIKLDPGNADLISLCRSVEPSTKKISLGGQINPCRGWKIYPSRYEAELSLLKVFL